MTKTPSISHTGLCWLILDWVNRVSLSIIAEKIKFPVPEISNFVLRSVIVAIKLLLLSREK